MKKDNVLKYMLCSILLFCFYGCSTPITIQASNHKNSNLNNRGDNVPVMLVVYQLKDTNKFNQASVEDLVYRESILGRDNLDSLKMQIPPNEKNMLVAQFNKREGKYIGVLALFANPQDKKQKVVKKLHRVFRNVIHIHITQDGIMEGKR